MREREEASRAKNALIWGPWIAAAACTAFLILFWRQPLEEYGLKGDGSPFLRSDFLPLLWLPDEWVASRAGEQGAWSLADRLPLWLAAACIWLVAAAVGSLALRAFRLREVLTGLEHYVFATGLGLHLISLWILALGLCGLLHLTWLWLLPAGAALALQIRWWRWRVSGENLGFLPPEKWGEYGASAVQPAEELSLHWLWLAAPFITVLLLGAVLPPVDFDVREYHLQAPKEFFEQGRVTFLPHNVYANMPLGAEMQALLAMVLARSWFAGALVGKVVMAGYTALTALALLAAGRRLHSRTAGIVAALVYLSIPWVLRVSTSGLNDCAMGLYLCLAWYAWWLAGEVDAWPARLRLSILAGVLAGAAVSCKYPAALFVAVPLWLGCAWQVWRGSQPADAPAGPARYMPVAAFALAVLVSCGLWLGKNAALTGNPTYPLLYEVFGGATRTPEKNAQWDEAHRPPNFSPQDLLGRVARVALTSDWQSPLVAPLAVLAFVTLAGRRRAWGLAALLGFIFIAWWLATHRIDRFWIPALPLAALLAGMGAAWSTDRVWRIALLVFGIAGLASNLLFATLPGPGYDTRYFAPLAQLRTDPVRVGAWPARLNKLPEGSRVLAVGEAEVFDLTVPVLYNTVFDTCLWEELARGRSAAEIHAALKERQITHVYVAWGEIARYRSPGNYGFTDFVTRESFAALVTAGRLAPPERLPDQPGELYRVR